MMPYSVAWLDHVIEELAEVWLCAEDRAGVTAAVAAIEARLTIDPATAGNEISEGLWKATEGPLVIYYSIETAKRKVEVGGVRAAQ